MELNLKNKVFLLTGGTGGIGETILENLYSEGAKIIVQYHKNEEKAQLLEIKYSSPERVLFIQADLNIENDITELFLRAKNKFGRIDGLIANAGIWPSQFTLTSEMSLIQWNKTIGTNLTGIFICVREFFKNLKHFRGENATIVMIGSTAGKFGEAGHADYAATKSAIMYGLTNTWKNEIIHFAPLGRVNTVSPGWVLTPMAEKELEDKKTLKKVFQTIPLKKVASPKDVANMVVYLLSDSVAGHITGESIFVHGGMEGRVLHNLEDI